MSQPMGNWKLGKTFSCTTKSLLICGPQNDDEID